MQNDTEGKRGCNHDYPYALVRLTRETEAHTVLPGHRYNALPMKSDLELNRKLAKKMYVQTNHHMESTRKARPEQNT